MSRSHNRSAESPSFSSSLLDRVLLSIGEIDEPPCSRVRSGSGRGGYSSTSKTQTKGPTNSIRFDINKWREEKKTSKVGTSRRNFETDAAKAKHARNCTASKTDRNDFTVTTIPMIDSSIDGLVSTSYDHAELKPKSPTLIGERNLKPIRTSCAASRPEKSQQWQSYAYTDSLKKVIDIRHLEGSRHSLKPEPEAPTPSSSFLNAKMHGQLKDVKQPFSPGSKLTRFITSLFSKRNSTIKSDKVREHESGADALRRMSHVPVTTCSSAPSYYRSCLRNKSPSSSKRSVRFYPSDIVVDGVCGQQQRLPNPGMVPSHEKNSQGQNNEQSQRSGSVGENCGIASQGHSDLRELLKKCNKNDYDKLRDEDRDDDGGGSGNGSDGGSWASSDLFELDHIGGSARGAINDELPVYETTQFHSKNPAICFSTWCHEPMSSDRRVDQDRTEL